MHAQRFVLLFIFFALTVALPHNDQVSPTPAESSPPAASATALCTDMMQALGKGGAKLCNFAPGIWICEMGRSWLLLVRNANVTIILRFVYVFHLNYVHLANPIIHCSQPAKNCASLGREIGINRIDDDENPQCSLNVVSTKIVRVRFLLIDSFRFIVHVMTLVLFKGDYLAHELMSSNYFWGAMSLFEVAKATFHLSWRTVDVWFSSSSVLALCNLLMWHLVRLECISVSRISPCSKLLASLTAFLFKAVHPWTGRL